jgi:hypothetical protein
MPSYSSPIPATSCSSLYLDTGEQLRGEKWKQTMLLCDSPLGFLGKDSSALTGWTTTGLRHDMFIYGLFNDAASKGKRKVHPRTDHEG